VAEFEAERGMPADAQAVFEVVADLDRLTEWLPMQVDVRPVREGEVHAQVEQRQVDVDGLVRVRPEQLRVEWGSDATPDYAGWLQVEHAGEGRSSVVLHLSFFGKQPETRPHGQAREELQAWLADGLDRLERLVAAGNGQNSPG
jgi:uncharacterized protein YndB with AHSA1/START domain